MPPLPGVDRRSEHVRAQQKAVGRGHQAGTIAQQAPQALNPSSGREHIDGRARPGVRQALPADLHLGKARHQQGGAPMPPRHRAHELDLRRKQFRPRMRNVNGPRHSASLLASNLLWELSYTPVRTTGVKHMARRRARDAVRDIRRARRMRDATCDIRRVRHVRTVAYMSGARAAHRACARMSPYTRRTTARRPNGACLDTKKRPAPRPTALHTRCGDERSAPSARPPRLALAIRCPRA